MYGLEDEWYVNPISQGRSEGDSREDSGERFRAGRQQEKRGRDLRLKGSNWREESQEVLEKGLDECPAAVRER